MVGGYSYTYYYTTADGWGLQLHLLLHDGRWSGVIVILITTLRQMVGGYSYTYYYTTADGWGLGVVVTL